jgi:hypothetical protein
LQEVATKLDIPQQDRAQLHTGFLIYNSKRTELTGQMQKTMSQLQLLLVPLTQEPSPQAEQRQQQQQQQRQLLSSHPESSTPLRPADNRCSPSSATTRTSSSDDSSSSSSAATAVAHQGQQSTAPDTLECMEQADRLLQQLSRQVRCLREASRCLIFQCCNVVDPLQLSMSVLHSWPFIMQPPPVVEVLVKQQVDRQQQEDSTTDDGDG